jgi:hypothetical protein
MAHWLFEKTIGEPMLVPCVDSAISFSRVFTDDEGHKQLILIGGLEKALADYSGQASADGAFY